MPRRRALTEAQLESLLALPVDRSRPGPALDPEHSGLAVIERRRGDHNQLGFALQLCAFRYPGRLLRPGEIIPEPALRFVADQLRVGAERLPPTPPGCRPVASNLMGCATSSASACSRPGHSREMLAWLLPVAGHHERPGRRHGADGRTAPAPDHRARSIRHRAPGCRRPGAWQSGTWRVSSPPPVPSAVQGAGRVARSPRRVHR